MKASRIGPQLFHALKTYQNAMSKEPALFPPDSKTGDALPVIWDDDNIADLDARFKKLGTDAAAALATIKDEASFKAFHRRRAASGHPHLER